MIASGDNTVQGRIHRALSRYGVTREAVQKRVDECHVGGRLPRVRLQDWKYGAATVAAMLELIEEGARASVCDDAGSSRA